MKQTLNTTWIALIGAVVIPLGALVYLANLPGGGRGSLLAILLQVALVIGSVVLFAIFLAKVVEQMNAGRVRRWLGTDEGQKWLNALPTDERAEFLDRLAGKAASEADLGGELIEDQSPVDRREDAR